MSEKRPNHIEPTIESLLFHALLTVLLGIILVNNQFDVQFSFRICLFQFSTCFEQPCVHQQENKFYQYIWYMSLYVADHLVCIPDGHLHRVTYTRCRIDIIDSPGDEHMAVRNM